jgi:hypothetical protein
MARYLDSTIIQCHTLKDHNIGWFRTHNLATLKICSNCWPAKYFIFTKHNIKYGTLFTGHCLHLIHWMPLTFNLPKLVFTFLCKVYQKQDYFNTKRKKQWNKQYFMENITEITHSTFPCCLSTRNKFLDIFYCVLLHMLMQVLKC